MDFMVLSLHPLLAAIIACLHICIIALFHAHGHGDGGCAAIVGLIARDNIYVVSNSNRLAHCSMQL